MSNEDRVKREARELAENKWPGRPDGDNPLAKMKRNAFTRGYIERSHISPEQIEAAAQDIWFRYGGTGSLEDAKGYQRDVFLNEARAVFESAGFIVEGQS